MSDRTKALIGLAVVLILAAFPMWQTLGAADESARPELELPEDETQCIEEIRVGQACRSDVSGEFSGALHRRVRVRPRGRDGVHVDVRRNLHDEPHGNVHGLP